MKALNLMTLVALLPGCAMMDNMSKPRHDPEYVPAQPASYQMPKSNNGSIYQSGYEVRLFEDIRARRIGDILTINLVEKTDAKKQADTDFKKDNTSSMSAPTILGVVDPSLKGLNLDSSLTSAHDFAGEAESTQNNSLSGSITVSVVDVLPNGYLKIRGEKRVRLNQGNEYIRLAGIVRPTDINPDNSIESTKIADATIMYTGEGALADANKAGWLARFFISAIFPF
ncbi:MAG: flagellar basal body L-ring protein FlgH [Cycloclasticus sp.]|nr:flagellar basal body L-ring protein FlgH [Cycloclasticus sp.]MBG97314.1 flagellar basal body L-ring protein FlgH [Cycloclasticus sp.]HAI97110.1 flagellar basal body L-ring protein FlgH [Methylococcaceae bacterium]